MTGDENHSLSLFFLICDEYRINQTLMFVIFAIAAFLMVLAFTCASWHTMCSGHYNCLGGRNCMHLSGRRRSLECDNSTSIPELTPVMVIDSFLTVWCRCALTGQKQFVCLFVAFGQGFVSERRLQMMRSFHYHSLPWCVMNIELTRLWWFFVYVSSFYGLY